MIRTYKTIGIRIALLLGIVGFLAVLMLVKDPIGITFATGGIQLKIDSRSLYNGVLQPGSTWELKNLVPGVDKFFNFEDIKPGDQGTSRISLHTNDSAWACLDFSNLVDKDNGNNEPEAQEDINGVSGGELSKGIEFFSWFDDGDSVFEVGEKTIFGATAPQAGFDVLKKYILADGSKGEPFKPNVTRYVAIQWCAGDLQVNTTTGVISCDGSTLGNGVQTDSFSVDVSIRATGSYDNKAFRCEGGTATPKLKLVMEKKFNGLEKGFKPEQFSFRIKGEAINTIVKHKGAIELPLGTYTITEIVPQGFVIPDWKLKWSGDICKGEYGAGSIGTIVVTPSNIKKGTTSCTVTNQYKPVQKKVKTL